MSNFIPNSFQVPNAFVDEYFSKLSTNAVICFLVIERQQGSKQELTARKIVEATNLTTSEVIRAHSELVRFGLIKPFISTISAADSRGDL